MCVVMYEVVCGYVGYVFDDAWLILQCYTPFGVIPPVYQHIFVLIICSKHYTCNIYNIQYIMGKFCMYMYVCMCVRMYVWGYEGYVVSNSGAIGKS